VAARSLQLGLNEAEEAATRARLLRWRELCGQLLREELALERRLRAGLAALRRGRGPLPSRIAAAFAHPWGCGGLAQRRGLPGWQGAGGGDDVESQVPPKRPHMKQRPEPELEPDPVRSSRNTTGIWVERGGGEGVQQPAALIGFFAYAGNWGAWGRRCEAGPCWHTGLHQTLPLTKRRQRRSARAQRYPAHQHRRRLPRNTPASMHRRAPSRPDPSHARPRPAPPTVWSRGAVPHDRTPYGPR
jgi:hypothetical protein